MEQQLSWILLAVAGILLLLLIGFSLRNRKKTTRHQKPELGSMDELASASQNFDPLDPMEDPRYNSTTSAVEPIVGDPLDTASEWKVSKPYPNYQVTKPQVYASADVAIAEPPQVRTKVASSYGIKSEAKTKPKKTTSSGLIIMMVTAKEGEHFIGYDLLQALLAAGLRFGDMSIFHRYQQATGEGKKLFSLAQAKEPGVFDMNTIGACRCTGLTLFMQLTGPEHNLDALEIMLNCAQQLAEDLDGLLLEKNRRPLAQETVNYYQRQVERHILIANDF